MNVPETDPQHFGYNFAVPRWIVNGTHEFRRKLNPRYDDDGHPEKFFTRHPLFVIRSRLRGLGFELDTINQFSYPDQVLSGHLYFRNGRQLHVRVRRISKGYFKIQAHTEWNARYYLFRHIMYADLDYEEGYEMFIKMWRRASAPPGSGIIYRTALH